MYIFKNNNDQEVVIRDSQAYRACCLGWKIVECPDPQSFIAEHISAMKAELGSSRILDLLERPYKLQDWIRAEFHMDWESCQDDPYEILGITEKEVIAQLCSGKWAIVTRSCKPTDGTPWKRFGKRSFWWVVPMKDAYADCGRRIEWSQPPIFDSRKAALEHMYR